MENKMKENKKLIIHDKVLFQGLISAALMLIMAKTALDGHTNELIFQGFLYLGSIMLLIDSKESE